VSKVSLASGSSHRDNYAMDTAWSWLTQNPGIAFWALGVLVILVAALVALRPRPFRPSLTIDELLGFATLNLADPGQGTDAVTTFYEWRQNHWTVIARGCGALAVSLLLALVGASLEAGKTVTEEPTNPTGGGRTVTRTEADTSPEVLGLVGGLLVLGSSAWFRTRALHREFSADIGRLADYP